VNVLGAFKVLFDAVRRFFSDRVLSLSAAVSFYTLLSFAPLMVLVVWISSSLGAGEQQAILQQIAQLAGPEARDAAEAVIENARERPSLGSLAGIGGIGVTVLAATAVFGQLQTALNSIWGIRARARNAIWGWLRQRLLSLGLIAAIGFVLIVSLVVSAIIGLFLNRTGPLWDLVNTTVSAVIFAGLFALVFRYLPDAHLPRKYAWFGGIVTAVLFVIGKGLIGLYLANGNIGSSYGAAAFVVLLLVWVYYASAIFFFGAEVVQAYVVANGERIALPEHAEPANSADTVGEQSADPR
jgi:membrane protein